MLSNSGATNHRKLLSTFGMRLVVGLRSWIFLLGIILIKIPVCDLWH